MIVKRGRNLRLFRSSFVFFLVLGLFTAPTVSIQLDAENNHIYESIANQSSYIFNTDFSFSDNLICPIDFADIKTEINHFNSISVFLYNLFVFIFVFFKFLCFQKFEKPKTFNKYIKSILFIQTVK